MGKVISRKQPTKAQGRIYDRGVNPKIAITFDVETFELIREAAVRHGFSFGEAVRVLVAAGISAKRGKAGAA